MKSITDDAVKVGLAFGADSQRDRDITSIHSLGRQIATVYGRIQHIGMMKVSPASVFLRQSAALYSVVFS